MEYERETRRLAFPDIPNPPKTYISYGIDFTEACAKQVTLLGCKSAYVIASRSLVKYTDHLPRLQAALGATLGGTRVGLEAHTYLDELLEIIKDARARDADCIITLGGSSIADGAKLITYALANDITTLEDLDTLSLHGSVATDGKPPVAPIICLPSSLSGGEYSRWTGATVRSTYEKKMFSHVGMAPSLIVLDPQLTVSMPERTFLSSGVRAIDHCVGGICSVQASEQSDKSCARGLVLLVRGLLKCKQDPHDLQARLECQLGVNLSMQALQLEVWMGASHGIGHQLGPLGVGHGETSCILMPAVMKYNKRVNGPAQERAKKIIWADETAAKVLTDAGLAGEKADLGDTLDIVLRSLGMPRTLRDVGIGRDKFDVLAENSLRDFFCQQNPIPLTEVDQVKEILEMVAE